MEEKPSDNAIFSICYPLLIFFSHIIFCFKWPQTNGLNNQLITGSIIVLMKLDLFIPILSSKINLI